MEEVDRARALNALLALPRLERMLRVYRTWVNMEGVEGGMALSRRELQCVLEFPALDQHVTFLFDTFQCRKSLSTRNISSPRVDLVTLLTTAALLAQGALADKARFVFSLVDLDTEDDIVEAELALVISTCCNGLLRLGLIKEEEEMTEMDAMAVAYEAFDFVELEDGDKMTLAMFLKWFVFHPRPKELLERVSCLFSVCDAVRKMKEALEERRRSLNVELFRRYNDVHFGSLDEQAEGVGVLAGPMAGKVSAVEAGVLEVGREDDVYFQQLHAVCQILGPVIGCVSPRFARVLIECDGDAEVACVAIDRLTLEEICVAQLVKAYRPAIFVMTELTPGRTYDLSYRGLLKKETGVLQTPREHLPAFRLVIVSEDRYLDGCIAALAHDLERTYTLFNQEGQPDDIERLQNTFYIQNYSEARLILGPILGRITPRTARILVELDRAVLNLVCHLTDSATAHSYSMQAKVDAFTPTILKIEGLQPGTRYSIHFEGLMESKDTVLGYVLTPPWVSLTSEWLVVNCNSMADFLTTERTDSLETSQWPRILANGMSSFTAQLAGDISHRNGDPLGDRDDEEQQNFNPWHSIEDEYLSEPLSSPQLLLHLGGQVDMSRAFTNEELAKLIVRLAGLVESSQHNEDTEEFQKLRAELRHRMQEAYRVSWGVPPMKRLLRYCSNLMLLNEGSDLYFSRNDLLRILGADDRNEISDAALGSVVAILRGLAFELWQLYQNQLWVDLAERELKYDTKSSGNKTAFSTTFGINRIVVANVNHEVHAYCNAVETEGSASKMAAQTSGEASNASTISLFSAASWKIIDEALENSNTASEAGSTGATPARPKNSVQQLVLVVSGDLMEWGGSKLFPALRSEVPMHEAAFECFEWVRRELNVQGTAAEGGEAELFLASLRRKVRQRLQQRYHLCWNVPNVRETLAHTSNWFLRSQADVAPFFRNHEALFTEAARIVLGEAKAIVADYQLSLMQQDPEVVADVTTDSSPNTEAGNTLLPNPSEENRPGQPEDKKKHSEGINVPKSMTEEHLKKSEERNQTQKEAEAGMGDVDNASKCIDTAQFIHNGEVGIFVCDMRNTPRNDVVTCNNRLLTPLTPHERAVIGEKQWMQLEKALKKKAVMVFVLCLELPLILTDAKHVDAMREETTLSGGADPVQEEATGRWKLYDRQTISQHWVSCRRQLEQLLNLLFRWKAKHRGRDVIVLSGGMRVGLETLLQDHETKLSIRNVTVGPLTAWVEPDFDNMPLDGTACPTFMGSAAQRDERFTFTHSIVSNKNYLLIHAVVTREQAAKPVGMGEARVETKSASIETEFITDDDRVDSVHPVNLYQRFPTWWANYVPMGKIVFWDDTVMMRAQSDEDMTALARYLQDGRDFTAALEVLFEKHQFAEAARMEELRSKHRRRQQGPEELRVSLRAVFAELWKLLPDTHRQRLVYFRDEFVFDFLLGYIAPELFENDIAQDEDAERPPLEFAAFSALCRDFIFNACVLHLSLRMQQEDELRTIALQRVEGRRQAAQREAQRLLQDQQRVDGEAELERLWQEDPDEYTRRKLAEQEGTLQEKQAKSEAAREQRKAEKLRDVEEELAIAKKQRKLDKLAESGNDPHEFDRRRELLAARIRKLDERKRHRETEEARRREKKERKKKAMAAQQKNT
ncbi:hypothetical protein PRIC2_001271 [Phytophthora ramorum]